MGVRAKTNIKYIPPLYLILIGIFYHLFFLENLSCLDDLNLDMWSFIFLDWKINLRMHILSLFDLGWQP